MKITQDVRDYAAEQGMAGQELAERGMAEQELAERGMAEKSAEFLAQGAEVYHKA
jgi:phosphomethylpyrimidine synthase